MEWAVSEIKKIQSAARSGKAIVKPRWPVLIMRTPKVCFVSLLRIMQPPSLFAFYVFSFPLSTVKFPQLGNCYCCFADVHDLNGLQRGFYSPPLERVSFLGILV